LYIGAVDGLYKLEGTPQLATATTVFNGTNVKFDYKLSKLLAHAAGPTVGNLKSWQSLISFDGSLWGAMNGQLVRVRTGGGSIGSYRVENQPVPSGWVASLAAAGGLLFAAIQVTGGLSQLWGYDPQTGGWWRLAANFNIFYLFSGGEIVTNGQLMACRPNEAKLSRWAFNSSNPSGFESNNFGESWPGNSGYVTLPLLTPDDLASYAGLNNGRVGLVQVLRLGLEWHNFGGQDGWQGWPNVNAAGGGLLYYAAELSLDGGASWLTLNTAIVFDKYFPLALATGRTDWTIPTSVGLIKPVSRIYQGAAESDSNGLGWLFRLKVNGPISYLVRRAWVDFKLIEFNPQLGRRWKLALDLSNLPESIGLDGQPNPATPGLGEPPSLSGALLMAWRLWNLWKSGKTVSFYDLDGSGPYYVKLIGMRQEQVAPGYQPALKLAANWLAQIELVEVSE